MKRVMFTSPSYDNVTQVLTHWVEDAAQYVESLSRHKPITIKGNTVTADNFHKLLGKHKPPLVTLSGHGGHDNMFGQNHAVLHHVGDDHDDLKGSIVHAVACYTANNFGKTLVDAGAKGYIGFTDEFKLHFLDGKTSDPIASLTLKPAYEVTKMLASGSTIREAWVKSQKMFAANYRAAALAKNIDTDVVSNIAHNMSNHIFHGDENAVVEV